MKKQIGWYNLKEDKVFYNTFECAAWYEEVMVPAGKYPIDVIDYKVEKDGKIYGYIDSAYVTMEGTILSDEFGSRFCGVPVGTYDNKKNAGKKSSHTMHVYLYSLAKHILDVDNEWELLPEYEAREINFVSSFDGREITTHGVFKR